MNNVPQHVSIIMDGNGRWAKARGKERVYGHGEGVESVRACTEAAVEAGVKYLSLYVPMPVIDVELGAAVISCTASLPFSAAAFFIACRMSHLPP